ncbi:MAG: gamma-glutamyltransferase [Actinobacteria bacterium]|nr:gamma-glutamyltransferase [Actinomycetota bacterium]
MDTLAPISTRLAVNGMVCSVDHLASSAGVAMLRRGGNAVDAALAANAVLAVTTQHMCGMGGDLFALVHEPGEATPAVLNASGRSGSGADPERLRAEGHERVPRTGHISAVPVPGCVDGWVALHERFARLELAELLEPARRYADEGFAVSPTLAVAARRLEGLGLPGAGDFPTGPALYAGARMRRPGVARALAAVAGGGRAAFYEGEFGQRLLDLGNGEFSVDDLASPGADWMEGLALDVWGRRLWSVPPNSQGYLTLAGAWITAGLPVPDDPADPLWAHLLVEAARQAGYDRQRVLHEGADGHALLAEERLAPRRDAISAERAAPLPGSYGGGGTIYLCAADSSGMGVSLIQSNYAGFGSLIVVPELGIFLQNRGAGFSLEPGHPAEYRPRRRPPHTLAPALVTFPDGSLDCLLGTMGGDSQPQILLQLLARRYLSGQDPATSVAAARWVLAGDDVGFDVWHRHGDVRVTVEDHAPPSWFEGLSRRGHRVARMPAWSGEFGHAHLIALGGGTLAGTADPRSLAGDAAGW